MATEFQSEKWYPYFDSTANKIYMRMTMADIYKETAFALHKITSSQNNLFHENIKQKEKYMAI